MFRILPRFNSSPIDDNRIHGLIALNTVGNSVPLPISGFQLSGVGALATALVDGSGNQITATNPLAVTLSSGSSVIGHVITDSGSTTAVTNAGTFVTQLNDGTNTANILKSDGTAAGQNSQLVSGTGMTTATLTLNSGSPNTAWFDMLNYSGLSLEILTNTTPATLTFQTSGDASETNTNSMQLVTSNGSGGGQVSSTTSTNQNFYGSRAGRYFRVSSNVAGGNTVTLVITFYTSAPAMHLISISGGSVQVSSSTATGSTVPSGAYYMGFNDGNGNLIGASSASRVTDASSGGNVLSASLVSYNGTTWDRARSVINATNSVGTGITAVGLVAQVDDVSPTTITENQFGNVRMSPNRALMVEQVFTATHISTSTTTTVKSGAGFLHLISVNTKGTVASTITVYDNTAASGTVLAIIDSLNLSGAFLLDINFTTGLTIVTTGTVAPDVTVSWR